VKTLTEAAAQGVQASQDLAAMKFTAAFDKALKDGKLDAKPETRELHAAIYAGDPEQSLKLLASLPTGVVNLGAKGDGGDHADAPAGVDEESYQLDRRVKAHAAEHKCDYVTALDAVMAQDEMKAEAVA
ncbi:MAG: hypothetical protein LC635_01485, partial [Pseudonocardiaceae bacterium]|nr:hypothetical protein [Pseudonocardiaceae bacterium]